MPKKALLEEGCPFTKLIHVLSRPWTLLILHALHTNGATRFGALRRLVGGISPRLLTDRLRLLERNDLVFRRYEASVPPKVTYGYTQRMEEFGKFLEDINKLAIRWDRQDSKERPLRRSHDLQPTGRSRN
jgi:DNA-binding HxlR family transcriptional regulator